jgi:hypothetical protein
VADVNKRTGDTDLLNTLSRRVVVGEAVETKYVRLQSG